MNWDDITLGPKMQACSELERRFVWALLTQTGKPNATEAAREAGYKDSDNGGIRVRAHVLMHRERVLEALEEVGRKAFRGLLLPSILATRALIENEKHPDHARTVQSTLSRLGFGERSGLDVNVSGEVTLNHTDAAVDDLRRLKALCVPQSKLEEIFGFSGLARYERMLAEADRRAPKLIEGEIVSRETGASDGTQ